MRLRTSRLLHQTPGRMRRSRAILLAASSFAALLSYGQDAFVPEPTGQVARLPVPYPDHWIVAHDAAFTHMLEGEVVVIDPLADTVAAQYKGMFPASFMANMVIGAGGREFHVLESFFSRGGRGGERKDFVTTWDAASLTVTGEIEIPPRRLSSMPQRFAAALLDDDRFLVAYNFAPGQTVSVVDLDAGRLVTEVQTAGCALVFPTGPRGFTSLCSNGGLLSVQLDETGNPAATERVAPMIDIDNDALFEKPVILDGTAWFPSFTGNLMPIDMRGATPVPGTPWRINADAPDWRPGGWQLIASDGAGLIYLLMHPDGVEGSHKNGGSEVWVLDPGKRRIIDRITLETWGVSVATTGVGPTRLLLVTNAEMGVDVYDIPRRKFVHRLSVEMVTPFIIHGVR